MSNNQSLPESMEAYGWPQYLSRSTFTEDPAGTYGRITSRQGPIFHVMGKHGSIPATMAGKLGHGAESDAELPVVGDWVALRSSQIVQVLPRFSALSRKESGASKQPGRTEHGQVLASNIERLILVWPCTKDPRTGGMIARFLASAEASGMKPCLALTKGDLVPPQDGLALKARMEQAWPGLPVWLVSSWHQALSFDPVGNILKGFEPGSTSIMVGLSGAGKSSLLKALLQTGEPEDRERADSIRIQALSEHVNKGRHTTTSRDMFPLPGGSLLIDNPGIREVGLWFDDPDSSILDSSFSLLTEIAQDCQFTDCSHQGEPGCAVTAAIQAGTLPEGILLQYRKLSDELNHLERSRLKPRSGTKQKLAWHEKQTLDSSKNWGKDIQKFLKNKKKEIW